jgi:PAS domain S-box-containing protein
VLADAADAVADGASLETLRSVLPRTMAATSQPPAFDVSLREVDGEAQRKQHRAAQVAFTRLKWSTTHEAALMELLSTEVGLASFGSWLQGQISAQQFELFVEMTRLEGLPEIEAVQRYISLCEQFLGVQPDGVLDAVALLDEHAEPARKTASLAIPRFMRSEACCRMVERMFGSGKQPETVETSSNLLWSKYEVPSDCAGWLHALAAAAEPFPLAVTISDMSVPGNPMIFTNAEFCRMTGYAKHEAQGQNCPFLQGPKTEPQSVAMIQDTLRRGDDCHVKITNYRKSGALFENLLTLRPVHDSNGVYRFCIGLQYEVEHGESTHNSRSLLTLLKDVIMLLPMTIGAESRRRSTAHEGKPIGAKSSTALAMKLAEALSTQTLSTFAPQILGLHWLN